MDASQRFGRFTSHSIALQAHVHLVVNDDPQVSFFCSANQRSTAEPIRMLQVFPPKVENLAFFSVKHHQVLVRPFAEFVQVSLDHPPIFWLGCFAPKFGVIGELGQSTPDSNVHIVNEDVEQYGSQDRALRDPTGHRSPRQLTSINHHPLGLTMEPIPEPEDCGGPKVVVSQFY